MQHQSVITMETHFQHQFSVRTWCSITGNHLTGHLSFGTIWLWLITWFSYTTCLYLTHNIPLQTQLRMWLQHDSAPPHVCWQVTVYLISIILIAWLIVLTNKPCGGGNTSHAPQPLLVGHVKDTFYQQISQTWEELTTMTFWNVMLCSGITG